MKRIALCIVFVLISVSALSQEASQTRAVSEKLIAQLFPSLIWESFKVSPDSKRVAYGAKEGDKWFVVVDEKEGKRYDGIVTLGGGKVIFDTSDNLHYLALKGNGIYLIEEGL